jgi:flagellar biosynthetic protein FliR
MTITADQTWITGFLLAMVRATAWVFTCPPFGTRLVPTTIKIGLAAALTLSLGPQLNQMAVPLEAGPLIGAAVLQACAGVALGFVGILLFSAFSAAGSMIDLFGGFTVAQLYDPLTQQTTSVFGRFYQLLATVLLFAVGGHLLLVRGFLDSFHAAPVSMPGGPGGAMAGGLAGALGAFFLAALEIAAPLLGALFLADIALGLLARSAPDLNVLLLGLPGKLLLTISAAGLTFPLLPGAVHSVTEAVVRAGHAIFSG